MNDVLIRRGNLNTQRDTRDVPTEERPGGNSVKMAICKPRREASEETKPASTLILDLQLPEL